MEYRILGPFEVRNDRGVVTLGGAKPRSVLAVLLLHANQPVSADTLARSLWGDDAPAGSEKTVQVHVSRLRKALGNGEIVRTTPAGYELHVDPGELDAQRFHDLVAAGRQALAAGEAEHASAVLRQALTLWRGPPLSGLTFDSFAAREIARLEEDHVAALEARVEADLAAGREAELVGELQHLVAEDPTRERLVRHLMLALYRCGRQTEALTVFTDARRALRADWGLEPGPELKRLQEAILHQDPSLERPVSIVPDVPLELDAGAAPPLEGRMAECAWLWEHFEHAHSRAGALVTLVGARGIGKTRIMTELAAHAHKAGAAVLYASGAARPELVLATLARAREATRPTLLAVDDADQAGPEVMDGLDEVARTAGAIPLLAVVAAREENALACIGAARSLVLRPLDADAVRAIACRYAPTHAREDVPAGWLLEASSGVPLHVHALAGQWARREAARRVGATAGRAADGRVELRSLEEELEQGIVDAQTADEQVSLLQDREDHVVCPFKGLAAFEVSDAKYYFGREQLVAELVARLVGAPLVGVIGPSGSGKSSALRAGLLPALASGVLPDSADWAQGLLRPGEHPMNELHHAVADLGDQRMVLAVDQFEETFTACSDEGERAKFVDALVRAARDPRRQAVVVIAVRADYYGRCAAYPELSGLLAANQVLVGPMDHDELRRAIELPARRAGLRVEPELTDALVADTEKEPGALPLLSSALLELWQRRRGRHLRHADYELSGGVSGAVARLAESAFARFDPAQQAKTHDVFMRLVGEGEDGGVERRRLPRSELVTPESDAVVDSLRDQRLLTEGEDFVEMAHEALLREWPRLRQWVEDDREGMRIHRRLTSAAAEWHRVKRDDDALYRGTRLSEALDWQAARDPALNPLEREFLDASAGRRERERLLRRRRIEFAFAGLALAIAAIAVVAIVAIHQRNDAKRERNLALSRALALQSEKEVDVDPELALRLALWADDTAATRDADAALRQAVLGYHQLAALPTDSLATRTAAYSPDGSTIVSGGDQGVVRIWDAASHRQMARLAAGHRGLLAASYAPDGRSIALGFGDGSLVVTDASLRSPRVMLRVRRTSVNSLAFSRDGRRLAAGLSDGRIRLLASSGEGPVQVLSGHRGAVLGVDLSADGRLVVSAGADGTVRVWDTSGQTPQRRLYRGGKPQNAVALTPDAQLIVAGGEDSQIRLWSVRSGAQQTRIKASDRALLAVAFSRSGRRFAAGGADGVTRVWSIAGGPPVAVLRGQGGQVYDVAFGRSDQRVVTAGDDGNARVWDAGSTQVIAEPAVTYNIDFNRNGSLIASGSDDGVVRVWDAASGALRASLRGPAGPTLARFSPIADEVVVGRDSTSELLMWPLANGAPQPIAKLGVGRGVYSVRLDAGGRRVVSVDRKARATVHDLRSGRTIVLGGAPEDLYEVQLSADGREAVGGTESGKVVLWRLDRPTKPERVLTGHHAHVNTAAFGRDVQIVTASGDRTVRVWNRAGDPGAVLRGHNEDVTTATFTRDGRRIVSSSADGTVRLWDARGGDALAVLESGGAPLYDLSLSADGKIATLDGKDFVRVFRCDVCGDSAQVRALARSREPRQLTRDERERFLAAAR
jgi:WD40 repeat protein/DNA-binding winged helix-turn-helix (wHTH) protein